MTRRSLQNQKSPNQDNNQVLENLIERLNLLEITISEVSQENRQLRRTNSLLETRLARIERRVQESNQQDQEE